MNIYLAARYSRREELVQCKQDLEARGHKVPARWLLGNHQIDHHGTPLGEDGEALVEGSREGGHLAAMLRQKFATDDLEDLAMSKLLVAFTEPPRSTAGRGGRHVELGVAIALGIPTVIVGPRENVFCWLPNIPQFDEWPAALAWLDKQMSWRRPR